MKASKETGGEMPGLPRVLQIILYTTKEERSGVKVSKKIRGEMPGLHTLPVCCFFFVPFAFFVVNACKFNAPLHLSMSPVGSIASRGAVNMEQGAGSGKQGAGSSERKKQKK